MSKYSNFNISDPPFTIRGKNWAAGDRRADLNSIALILIAFDVGLDTFKMVTKSQSNRKEFDTQYIRDETYTNQIKEIVAHTILEEEPLYDLKDIVLALKRLNDDFTEFLQVKQEEME